MNGKAMIDGIRELVRGLYTCTWPDGFFADTLGLSGETTQVLPQWAQWFLMLYFIMAAVAIVLHFWKKQRSFSDFGRKFADFLLTAMAAIFIRAMILAIGAGQELSSGVPGSFSFSREGLDWLGKMVSVWFYPAGLCMILLATLLMPLSTVKRYLKAYKMAGVFWSVYDVGFGCLFMSAAVLSMWEGNAKWYLAVPLAMALIALGQTGGTDVE